MGHQEGSCLTGPFSATSRSRTLKICLGSLCLCGALKQHLKGIHSLGRSSEFPLQGCQPGAVPGFGGNTGVWGQSWRLREMLVLGGDAGILWWCWCLRVVLVSGGDTNVDIVCWECQHQRLSVG